MHSHWLCTELPIGRHLQTFPSCSLSVGRSVVLRGYSCTSGKFLTQQAGRAARRGRIAAASDSSERSGLILECDGVVADVHNDGHRVAFNRAFEELGFDCTNWSPSVYHDLKRTGDGSAEGILTAYFNTVGWPMVIPSSERRQFVAKVHELKRKALSKMVDRAELALRPGVIDLIDEAVADGASVSLLAGTASTPGERIVDAVVAALGPGRAGLLGVFTCSQEGAIGGGGAEGGAEGETQSLSLEQHLAEAQAKVKNSEAMAFVRTLRGPQWGGSQSSVEVGVDPSLMAASRRAATLLSPAWLAAVAAARSISLRSTALLAANELTMKAARGAGMLTVAIPAGLSSRGRFQSADVQFDGFGPGGGVTWGRIKLTLEKRQQAGVQ